MESTVKCNKRDCELFKSYLRFGEEKVEYVRIECLQCVHFIKGLDNYCLETP